MKAFKKLCFLLTFLLLASALPYVDVNAAAEGIKPVNLRISINSQSFLPGDKLTVSVDMDNITDYTYLDIQYRDPVTAYNTFSLRLNPDSTTGVFMADKNVQQYNFSSGTWKVNWIHLYDKNGADCYVYNSSLYTNTSLNLQNLDSGNFSVSGTVSDTQAPALTSVSVDKSNAVVGDKVIITVNVRDDISGADYCSMDLRYPDGTARSLSLTNTAVGVFKGAYNVGQYSQNGTFKIKTVYLRDNADNGVWYYNSILDSSKTNAVDLSAGDFTVSGTTPDTTAPTLISVNVDKKNAVTNDTVKITINAGDDFSGVKSCSLQLHNPNGVDQYMTLTETALGVFVGNYKIGQYSQNGTYKVRTVILADNADNSLRYYNNTIDSSNANAVDLSAGDFTVSGTTQDTEAPVLTSVSVDKKNAVPNDTVKITINATDDFSGPANCILNLHNPDGTETFLSPTRIALGVYEATYKVGQYSQTGTYKIESVNLSDNAGNSQWYYNTIFAGGRPVAIDLSAADFTVSGSVPDTKAPTIASVSLNRKTAVPGDTVTITIKADDASGAASCSILLYRPNGSTIYRSLKNIGSGQFQCSYTVEQYSLNGTYKIKEIKLSDVAGNCITYYNNSIDITSNNAIDLSTADFTVSGTTPDINPPDLKSVTIDRNTAGPGEYVDFTADISDDVSGISSVEVVLKDPKGNNRYINLEESNGSYYGSYYVGRFVPPGTYSLDKINTRDNAGNNIGYTGSADNYGGVVKDFSGCVFTVSGTIEDNTSPVFTGVSVNKKTAAVGDALSFNINCSDSGSGINIGNSSSGNISRVIYISPSGNKIDHVIYNSGSMYNSVFNVGKYTEAGLWRIYELYFIDEAGNPLVIGNSNIQYTDGLNCEKRDLSSADFTVGGTISDKDGPVFKSLSINRKSMYMNQLNTVSVQASDNLSGLTQGYGPDDTVNITYISSQGYLAQYDLKLKDGSYYSDMTMPQFNSKGLWKPAAITLSDNAGNTSYYVNSNLNEYELSKLDEQISTSANKKNIDLSSGNFNIPDSLADTAPPVLKGVSVDKPSVYGPGTATLTFEIQENCDTLLNNYIGYVKISSPSLGEHYANIKRSNGKYTSVISFGPYEENGIWAIEYVYLCDEAGNSTYIVNYAANTAAGNTDMDLSAGNIVVSGMKEDTVPPVLSRVVTGTKAVSVSGTVDVAVYASDDISGINPGDSVNHMTYESPSGKYNKEIELKYANGVLSGSLSFNKYDEEGIWRVGGVWISDSKGNSIYLYNSKNPYNGSSSDSHADLSAGDIALSGTSADDTKPEFKGVSVDRASVNPGESVVFTVNATDGLSGVSSGKIYYTTPSGNLNWLKLTLDNGVLNGTLDTGVSFAEFKQGIWKIESIYIYDNTGNELVVGNYQNDRLDVTYPDILANLSAGDVTVSGSLYGDVSGDGKVNITDLALSARNYNIKSSDAKWEARMDINKDNIVDIYDIVIIAKAM